MISTLALRASLVAAFAFLLAPVVVVVITAFNGGPIFTFPPTQFTTHWFALIKPAFIDATYVSLIVAFATALLSVVFGVPAALALSRARFPGRDTLSVILLSPLMIPALVTGVALYQASFALWDVTRLQIGGTIPGLVIGHLTFGIPFVVRAVLAGHARFDYALEEAALNLGATPLQSFWRVTAPVLRPSIIAGAIFAFVMSLDDVPIALFMGGGRATTLPVRIFTTVEFDFGGDVMAVAAAIVGVSVVAMILLDRVVGLGELFGAKQ
jgi:putative spermidine/putrescine transport system permease protein